MHRTKILLAAWLTIASTGAALAFGAIAVDDYYDEDPSEAGYGIATDYRNAREASIAAMEACKTEPTSECKVVLTFRKCGAYAASRGGYGAAASNTLKQAEQRALRQCRDPDCIVVASDCSSK
ncbi:MAG TPA: DUF4189 domain-containing protein [Xanthobacteraceae bacterium]|nr:DUF4189 domain-containing protein [Xanthobacteraceae bacterium]